MLTVSSYTITLLLVINLLMRVVRLAAVRSMSATE